MPKTLLGLLLALPFFSNSQITLTSLNVNHPDSNVVFIGLDNYLEVGTIDTGKDIRLSSTKASVSVSKVNATRFLVRVATLGETPFELYDYSTPTPRLLLSKSFMAQVLPSPEVRIGTTTDSLLTVQDILTNPVVQVHLPYCSFKHSLAIASFNLVILNANGKVAQTFDHTKGNRLTREQVTAIQGLSKGDQLHFTQLAATCPTCKNFTLPPYRVLIK